ncbi:MAG: hypothetical protein F4174_06290 [Acidobacteria bacterium]|nr:hypothetical protein [Acidobacteriota bacterium]
MRHGRTEALSVLPLAAALGCALLPALACAPDHAPRTSLLMDDGWRFFRGRAEGFVPLPQGNSVETWRFRMSEAGEAEAETLAAPGLDVSGWPEAAPGDDVFAGEPGFAWFRAELGALPPGPPRRPRI